MSGSRLALVALFCFLLIEPSYGHTIRLLQDNNVTVSGNETQSQSYVPNEPFFDVMCGRGDISLATRILRVLRYWSEICATRSLILADAFPKKEARGFDSVAGTLATSIYQWDKFHRSLDAPSLNDPETEAHVIVTSFLSSVAIISDINKQLRQLQDDLHTRWRLKCVLSDANGKAAEGSEDVAASVTGLADLTSGVTDGDHVPQRVQQYTKWQQMVGRGYSQKRVDWCRIQWRKCAKQMDFWGWAAMIWAIISVIASYVLAYIGSCQDAVRLTPQQLRAANTLVAVSVDALVIVGWQLIAGKVRNAVSKMWLSADGDSKVIAEVVDNVIPTEHADSHDKTNSKGSDVDDVEMGDGE